MDGPMCPFCIGSAVLVAGSLMSAGGLTTLVVNEFRLKKQAKGTVSPSKILSISQTKGGNMGQVTNEQVNLMLRLYEERREPKLREARDWFSANFHVKTADDLTRVCPPGSQENLYMRMVLGYWEMVTSIVNHGLIDEEFFFESNGEQWVVWEQVKTVIGAWRAMFSSPDILANLEKHATRLEAWREKRSPGSNEAIRKVLAQVSQATPAPKAQAASN
jgi:hypothetical protein